MFLFCFRVRLNFLSGNFSVYRNHWKYIFEFSYKVYLILLKIKDVHSSSFIIMKTKNNPNVHQQEGKQAVVHLFNGITTRHRKGKYYDTCNNMAESQNRHAV